MHPVVRNSLEQIWRNLPTHSGWEQSFLGRLAEDSEWNVDEFWILHAALLEVANSAKDSQVIDRDLALAVSILQQRVLRSVAAHYDPNDVLTIKGITAEDLYLFRERFEMAILGVFSGEVMSEASFDLVNPLRRDA